MQKTLKIEEEFRMLLNKLLIARLSGCAFLLSEYNLKNVIKVWLILLLQFDIKYDRKNKKRGKPKHNFDPLRFTYKKEII